MTNEKFKEYLEYRLESLRKLEKTDRPKNYAEQERMLVSALKIMTHGDGASRRRFRRDYERRLGL